MRDFSKFDAQIYTEKVGQIRLKGTYSHLIGQILNMSIYITNGTKFEPQKPRSGDISFLAL